MARLRRSILPIFAMPFRLERKILEFYPILRAILAWIAI